MHIMIADGHPRGDLPSSVEHMIMPVSHADAGATPRALAAISAFSRGYDSVAFLDADNTFEPGHLALMHQAMLQSGATIVTATRNICSADGLVLYIDRMESNGEDFCDTNCLFLGKSALHLLTCWVTRPEYRLWSDRQFWSAIKQSGITRYHCTTPSVNYHSRWAWHYQHAGLAPPADSVWVNTVDGHVMHIKHGDTSKGKT